MVCSNERSNANGRAHNDHLVTLVDNLDLRRAADGAEPLRLEHSRNIRFPLLPYMDLALRQSSLRGPSGTVPGGEPMRTSMLLRGLVSRSSYESQQLRSMRMTFPPASVQSAGIRSASSFFSTTEERRMLSRAERVAMIEATLEMALAISDECEESPELFSQHDASSSQGGNAA